tara:strand:+ start:2260 stop:2679 length:420 start_codon:yes stop_codon:yes gene_type:complete
MIYYKILHEQNYGWSAIAQSVGKTHATAIHGVRQFNNLICYDKELLDDYKIIMEVYSEIEQENPVSWMTRAELLNEAYNLDKQNKSLNLSLDELNHSLISYQISYQKYRPLIELIDERGLCDEDLKIVATKLKRILNGL